MENNYVIITINGVDYYIESDRLNDLAFIDNKLVNISNSNITLVNSFDSNNTTYPRITCSSMQQCILRSYSSSNYVGVTSNYQLKSKFNMNMLGINNQNNLIISLLFIILGVKLLWKH